MRFSKNMAKTPANVYSLLMGLWEPALEKSKKEAKDLQNMMNMEGVDGALQSYDWWYYTEKLRKEKYDLDENELRPYFSLEQVEKGALNYQSVYMVLSLSNVLIFPFIMKMLKPTKLLKLMALILVFLC